MIKTYILENYKNGEPIFINDLPCKSINYLRQELKKLVDSNELARLKNGIYYLPYKTSIGSEGTISFENYINARYLKDGEEGFLTGLSLINKYGFSSQNPSILELKSNKATTLQRKLEFNNFKYIVYSSNIQITKENYKELEFLELLSLLNKYSELNEEESKMKLKKIIKKNKIDFKKVKKYLDYFPEVIYKNIYKGGLMSELL
jgi:hypothetical protein